VRAELVRPTHGGHDLMVDLPYQRGGKYRQEIELPLAGQWDVRITAIEGGQPYRLSERIYVEP
jgi:nitrogen fixation protein FixH